MKALSSVDITKKKQIVLICSSLLFVLLSLFVWANALQSNTLHILSQAGFSYPISYDSKKSFGAIYLKNIILDIDQASTIKNLKAAFSFKNNATFLIDGLDLTGDTLKNALSISGFETRNFPFNLLNIKFDKTVIKNSRIALLTEYFGGLNINIDAQLIRNKTNALEFQTRFLSQQKQLSFGGQGKGTITAGNSRFKGTIEHLKLNRKDTALSRCNGTIDTIQSPLIRPKVTIDIQCGGAFIDGHPWKSLTGTIMLKNNEWKGRIKANSNKDTTTITGKITGPKESPVIKWIQTN